MHTRKRKRIILSATLLLLCWSGFAQSRKSCCANADCKATTSVYAQRISGIVILLGNCSDDKEANEAVLAGFRTAHPDTYRDLIGMVEVLDKNFLSDQPKYNDPECFSDLLPPVNAVNTMRWVNHIRFHILKVKPVFPSTEFCAGWSRRIEIGQGATAFLSKRHMTYLATVRGYAGYTFPGKEKCGGQFRLMAGPVFLLRQTHPYLGLSTRLAVRLADLKANVFSLGNINIYGGYNTSFGVVSLAEAGIEAELGGFGVNLSANYDTRIKRAGFQVGLVLANKKL